MIPNAPSPNSDLIKTPPHSIEAEQAVLGGLMLSNQDQAWDQAVERVKAEDFYRREHQLIFKAMISLVAERQPLDVITVSECLKKSERLNDVGGLAYIGELANNTPSAANISAYADIVHERAILRELVSVGTEITESAFRPDGRSSGEILDSAEQKVFNIAERGNKGPGPEEIKKILARSITQIETRAKDQNAISGISTGFKDFDKLTTGLHAGELIVIAGRPSMGKTSFAMNIAEYAAIKSEKSVLVFSMEMSGEDLATRMLSSIGRVDQNKLRTGNMADADWARISSAVVTLNSAKLYIDESPSLSPIELRARARRIARESDLGLIVIDYLQLMRLSGHVENRTAEISEISRSLKALAKELKVPVIALSQLNRSLEQRPNKRPIMSDLRESGAIEQDADLIAFIYRDEVYNEDTPDKGFAEIILGKHRNGPIGTLRLTFVGHCTRFDNFMSEQAFIPAG